MELPHNTSSFLAKRILTRILPDLVCDTKGIPPPTARAELRQKSGLSEKLHISLEAFPRIAEALSELDCSPRSVILVYFGSGDFNSHTDEDCSNWLGSFSAELFIATYRG